MSANTTEKRICQNKDCGIEFPVQQWRLKRGGGLYCCTKCKMHDWHKTHQTWNKGLPPDDLRIKSLQEKRTKTLLKKYSDGDIVVWNKGLTKETNASLAAGAIKQSILRSTPSEWKDNWKSSITKGQVKAYANGVYGGKETKPEKLTREYLQSIGWIVKPYSEKSDQDNDKIWYSQCPIEDVFVADFANPYTKEIIEVHGCEIHGHKLEKCENDKVKKYGHYAVADRNIKRDACKYNFYKRHVWKYAIIWECEIIRGCFDRLKIYLSDIIKI